MQANHGRDQCGADSEQHRLVAQAPHRADDKAVPGACSDRIFCLLSLAAQEHRVSMCFGWHWGGQGCCSWVPGCGGVGASC